MPTGLRGAAELQTASGQLLVLCEETALDASAELQSGGRLLPFSIARCSSLQRNGVCGAMKIQAGDGWLQECAARRRAWRLAVAGGGVRDCVEHWNGGPGERRLDGQD